MSEPDLDRLYARVEARRGRPVTHAERNIDLVRLNTDLREGKQKLRDAIEQAQAQAIRRWARRGYRGRIQVEVTPAIRKVLDGLYETGWEHGQAELRKAGVTQHAARTRAGRRIEALLAKLRDALKPLNARMAVEATRLDLGELSAKAIAEALARVPGALDAASRVVSGAVYAGLGAAFDSAAGQVDKDGGGNGWEYTAIADDATCDPCSAADGTEYDTWDEAQADLPDGGPNPECEGDGRCRCRLAPKPLG